MLRTRLHHPRTRGLSKALVFILGGVGLIGCNECAPCCSKTPPRQFGADLNNVRLHHHQNTSSIRRGESDSFIGSIIRHQSTQTHQRSITGTGNANVLTYIITPSDRIIPVIHQLHNPAHNINTMAAQKPCTLALNEVENRMADEVVGTWIKTAERARTLTILPPGVDAATWAKLVVQFRAILGDDGILTSHEHRVRYTDPYAEHQDETEQEKRGSAATLFPVTVEHIQGVLKICNEHRIPTWTVSRGKNLGYGGPAARVKVSRSEMPEITHY